MAADSDTIVRPEIRWLKDYQAPQFLIDEVDLVIDLTEEGARVNSRLLVRRNPDAASDGGGLRLDGIDLQLNSVVLDGERLGENAYHVDATGLAIPQVTGDCVIEIETFIRPQLNKALLGLYMSGGTYCTQCEPEGFRRITYFPDRPDVMARYTTTIVADKAAIPVLLSNGNPVDRGLSSGGRHWAKWRDPHPKPSYLFALVAGDLVAIEDSFTTRSGRRIALAIWVRRGDEAKCAHAMRSLKAAMAWDEKTFGLEYDLDVFNIVAVSDFNMGAMENKGLNIFNTRYVLAAPETATDVDYQGIERVIAHEYFHNWSGNRVTCRDWFQLSLKEGFTVFRDQEFMADQHSRAVRRIGDVRSLWGSQFPEDDGPLAHPVRPASYIEIDNFYTATVYNKGAEVVRMLQTLVGDAAFKRGVALYFQRHDNQAVTVEDFVAAIAEASGMDLSRFMLWYAQAGTPELSIEERYDPARRRFELTTIQRTKPTPGETEKQPLVIPLAIGLIGADGTDLPISGGGTADARPGTHILRIDQQRQSFVFNDVATRPVPSLLRGFSAPVRLTGTTLDRLKFLAAYDPDDFARWEAGQRVACHLLLDLVVARQARSPMRLDPDLIEIFRKCLADEARDPGLSMELLRLPSEMLLADAMPLIDVEAIHAAVNFAYATIGGALAHEFAETYAALGDAGPYTPAPAAMDRRGLRNTCLTYLALPGNDSGIALATRQFESADNMTDVLAALSALNRLDRPERAAALAKFYERWSGDDLVVDKWFTLQAMSPLPDTTAAVAELARHPAFDPLNPNRFRALFGAFSQANQLHFHGADGSGYRLLGDQILMLDRHNPQIAARAIQPLGGWRRHDEQRRAMMRAELERILAAPGLSKNCYEMASKSLQ